MWVVCYLVSLLVCLNLNCNLLSFLPVCATMSLCTVFLRVDSFTSWDILSINNTSMCVSLELWGLSNLLAFRFFVRMRSRSDTHGQKYPVSIIVECENSVCQTTVHMHILPQVALFQFLLVLIMKKNWLEIKACINNHLLLNLSKSSRIFFIEVERKSGGLHARKTPTNRLLSCLFEWFWRMCFYPCTQISVSISQAARRETRLFIIPWQSPIVRKREESQDEINQEMECSAWCGVEKNFPNTGLEKSVNQLIWNNIDWLAALNKGSILLSQFLFILFAHNDKWLQWPEEKMSHFQINLLDIITHVPPPSSALVVYVTCYGH